MVDNIVFIKTVLKKGLEPKDVFRDAVFKNFNKGDGDTMVTDRWEDIWAFCLFYGQVPNFVLEYVESLK